MIKQASGQYDCAGRLSLIFVAHDVDHISRSEGLELASGKGRNTAAFEEIAEGCSIYMDTVREDHKKSRNYMLLLEIGGPGSLLEVGTDVTPK
jgi:hypothetical protein